MQDTNDVETVIPADCLRLIELPAIHNELVAGDQAADPRSARPLRLHGIDGTALEIDDRQPLLNVQRTRLAIGAAAVPVIKAERGIAGLLYFRHQQACPEGMNRPGGKEEAIARLGLEAMEQFFTGSLANGVGQLPTINTPLKPGVDRATGIGRQDIPCLSLT